MDTGQKTESLAQLVGDIEKGAVVLPEFQRDFVWEVEKTFDLFDSFVRDIFVGALIYGIPSFEITVRELDKRPRKGKGSRAKIKLSSYTQKEIEKRAKTHGFRLLLDGQQRATSIFRALNGVDDVYFVIRTGEGLEKLALEEVLQEFSSEPKQDRINIKISDVYSILKGDYFLEEDKAKLFLASSRIKGISAENARARPEFYTYLVHSKHLENLFRQEKLVSYYLLDTDAEKFALFFERSNSKGIQLNFIDILAAKLYIGFNLREHIDKFAEDNPELKLNRDVIVRSISFDVSNGKDTGRSYILSKLTHTHFNKHWGVFVSAYKNVHEYLLSTRLIIHHDWMPYESMFIPLMLFGKNITSGDFSQISETQARLIKIWYWLAIFSRRYSSAAQTYVIEDSQAFEKVAVGDYTSIINVIQKLNPVIKDEDDLFNINKKYDTLYKGVLNFYNYLASGFLNLENGNALTHSSNLEDHHIFPKDYLRKREVKVPNDFDSQILIDCVLNRTLIAKLSNVRISNKKPSQYLQEIAKKNSNLNVALASHLIPVETIDGTYDDNYPGFLSVRAKQITEGLRRLLAERDQLIEEMRSAKS